MNDLGNYSMQKMLSEGDYMYPIKKKNAERAETLTATKKKNTFISC